MAARRPRARRRHHRHVPRQATGHALRDGPQSFTDQLRVLDRDLTGQAKLRHIVDQVGVTIALNTDPSRSTSPHRGAPEAMGAAAMPPAPAIRAAASRSSCFS
jgi:hypothetical protein